MVITLRKKIGDFGLKETSISFVKIGIASVLMGFIALWSFNFLGQTLSENLALMLAIGVGALVYAVLIYFVKVPEVEWTLEALKKKLRQRSTGTKGERG